MLNVPAWSVSGAGVVFAASLAISGCLYLRWASRAVPQQRALKHLDDVRVLSCYLRALPGSLLKRGWAAKAANAANRGALPGLCLTSPFSIAARHLSAYRELEGLEGGEDLPLLYLQVLLGKLMIDLISHPDFPYAAAGGVHLKNAITQYREISSAEALTVRCSLAPDSRWHRRGSEVDVEWRVFDESGACVWSSICTILVFHKQKRREEEQPGGGKKKAAQTVDASSSDGWQADIRVPSGVGRRFAALSSDYNPIHISNATAVLFGQKSAIAHGMWLAGRALAEVARRAGGPGVPARFPLHHTVRFTKPCAIPGTAELRVEPLGGSGGGGGADAGFSYVCAKKGDAKVIFQEGRVWSGEV